MHCLICGNKLQGCLCPNCGFDRSLCAEQLPTLAPLVGAPVSLNAQREAWDRRLREQAEAEARAAAQRQAEAEAAREEAERKQAEAARKAAEEALAKLLEAQAEARRAAEQRAAQALAEKRAAQEAARKAAAEAERRATEAAAARMAAQTYQKEAEARKKRTTLWVVCLLLVGAIAAAVGIGLPGRSSGSSAQSGTGQSVGKSSGQTIDQSWRTGNKQDTADYNAQPETEGPRCPSVGETVTFGKYEQDNNTGNGKEPIEWIVLDTNGEQALLLSKKGLERLEYQQDGTTATWTDCSLRLWLNGSFMNTAFSSQEQAMLVRKRISPGPNPNYVTDAGSATTCRVFLLSCEEIETYMPTAGERKCIPSDYVVAQGALVREGGCWWWTRTPGENLSNCMGISTIGGYDYSGSEVYDPGTVRPAMWVDYSG